MNVHIDELELSNPVKYIASLLIKRGAVCEQLTGTNIYKMTFRRKEYFFLHDVHPGVPYMYGIIFTPRYFWRQIMLFLKLPFVYTKPSHTDTISIFVTKDGFYNALFEKTPFVVGDGKNSLHSLIAKENMKRINSATTTIFPVRSEYRAPTLRLRLPKNKIFQLKGTIDYEDITENIDMSYIEIAKKILSALPGLSYLTVKLYIKDISSKLKFSIGACDLLGGMNIFFPVIKGKMKHNAGEKIVDFMVHI